MDIQSLWQRYLGQNGIVSFLQQITFDMMGILLAGTIAYKLAESDEVDPLPVMIISIVAYVIVTPKFVTAESGEVINKVLPMAAGQKAL